MNNSFKILLLSLLLSSLYSCKSKKGTEENIKLKNHSPEELIDLMKKTDVRCEWFTTKANIEIVFRGDANSLRSNIRMKKDSATWVSLSKTSIPVMTALISNDSLKVLNKIGKQYYLNNFESINEMLNTELDYELLQDFFLGKAIAFDDEGEYKVEKDEFAYLISSEKSKKIEKLLKKGKIKDEPILYRCWIEPVNYKCSKVIINLLSQEAELEVNYSDWNEINESTWFPMKSSLKLTTPMDTVSLEMDYNKAECEEELSFPFKIPSSYEPFEISNGGQ